MGLSVIIISIIALDQLTKFLIDQNMELGESIPVIQGIFHLTYSVNPGAAFGILAYQTTFFVIATAILLTVIIYLFIKLGPKFQLVKIALSLQFGGAVGNLVDRVRTGYVIDFLDLRVWPIFNVADMAIVVGVSLLIYFILFKSSELDLFETKV